MYHAHEPKSRVALLIPISRCMYVRTYRTNVRRHTASCPFVICFLKQLRRPIRRSPRWLPERPACKEQNTAWADVAQVCILGTWKLSPSLKDEKWGQDLVFPHLDPGDSDLDGQPPASIMEWKEYDNANRISRTEGVRTAGGSDDREWRQLQHPPYRSTARQSISASSFQT